MMSLYTLFFLTVLSVILYYCGTISRLVILSSIFLYILGELRHKFAYMPLIMITWIQGRKFRLVESWAEIKYALKFKDKGQVIEELFATPAWAPVLSLESTNGDLWEKLRNNFMNFVPHLPSNEKLGEIAAEEANSLIKLGKMVDSKQISISSFKIFVKWIFCENHLEEKSNCSEAPISSEFIDKFLNEDFMEQIYNSGLEYRKEIALKGKGDEEAKKDIINKIVNILNQSKFKSLFDWSNPECYSFIMQPFIISPMINISDIAVSLKQSIKEKSNFETEMDFIENCLFNNHPFPILERYDASTNTQYFIDLRSIKEIKDVDRKLMNFGIGFRSCLGRAYAREFMKSFFSPLLKETDLFRPEVNHLYSGRDNDNINYSESFYQVKVLLNVVTKEVFRRIKM